MENGNPGKYSSFRSLMQHFRSLDELHLKRSWLTIGSFDGVHRGHQTIVRNLTAGAHAMGAPAVVLTFDPHPATVLRPEARLQFLTTPEEKARLLGELGVEVVITHPFNRQIAALSAREFLTRLKRHLGFIEFWVGHDFAMGRNREGDLPTLHRLGREMGYHLKVVSPVTQEGVTVSSSQVRQLLREGKVSEATRLLGRPYQLTGEVTPGVGRGRTIGIPTANLVVPDGRLVPPSGVYACRAHVDGQTWEAVTNIGVRPTFETGSVSPILETHLLGFDHEIYGEVIWLDFISRLRGEIRFPDAQALVAQIHSDIALTRELLKEKSP